MRIAAALHCFSLLLFAALWPAPVHAQTPSIDNASAVILAYQRIGEDAYSDTNLRLDQFMAHIEEITHGPYHVMPLGEILQALKNQEPLPEKAIAITFEGAYRSAYDNAIPVLLERNIPFTVFYASDHADSGAEQHLHWKELKTLTKSPLATIGIHPGAYTRLSGETDVDILSQINRAKQRYREQLGAEPKFFSYPFGEHSLAYKGLIKDQGFTAGFGLHSGAVSSASDFYALPRFTMTELYGSADRFKLVANALPLPAHDVEPQDPYLNTDKPAIGFSVPGALTAGLKNLSCFISGQSEPGVEILGNQRVELRLAEPVTDERTRINCTMPGRENADGTPGWRWFGMLLVLRGDEDHAEAVQPVPTIQQAKLP